MGKISFAFILCAAAVSVYAAVPADGLVAYYPCSGSVANLAGTDLGKDTAVNVTFANDRFGNAESACAFDGETSYFSVPDNDAFSIVTAKALTVSVWISPDTLDFKVADDGCYVNFLGKGTSGEQEWTLRMYSHDLSGCTATSDTNRHNRISAYAFNLAGGLGSGSYWQGSLETPKDTVSAGGWVHIVARYDMAGNTIRIYKNAVKKDEDALNESEYNVVQENGTAPLRAGTRSLWTFFKGRIDDLRLYSRALSDDEISALYSESDPAESIRAAAARGADAFRASGIVSAGADGYIQMHFPAGKERAGALYSLDGRRVKEFRVAKGAAAAIIRAPAPGAYLFRIH